MFLRQSAVLGRQVHAGSFSGLAFRNGIFSIEFDANADRSSPGNIHSTKCNGYLAVKLLPYSRAEGLDDFRVDHFVEIAF